MAKEPLANKFMRFNPRKDKLREMVPLGYIEQLQKCVSTARRITLNGEASLLVEDLILNHPKLLLQSLDTARWPFETLFIEMDIDPLRTYAHELRGRFEFGTLIDQDVIYTIAQIPPRGYSVGWERYRVNNSSWSRDQQEEFFNLHQIEDRRFWVFGKLINQPGWKDVTEEDTQLLLDQMHIELTGVSDEFLQLGVERPIVNKITLGAHVLPALACMFVLNTPKMVTEVYVPASRHFSSGKIRKMSDHTEISINVTHSEFIRYVSEDQVRRNSEAEIARRRLHEVRGHFAHNQVARTAACVHTWIKDDERHFHCATCGGRRWWRPHHERGDEALGRIPPRQYRIT